VPQLSVTIITKNEAHNLPDALASVAWADEILVVDSGSTDETVAVARRFTDRVVSLDWRGYGEQKNHAASLAAHDWIMSLDADERVSEPLATEIQRLLSGAPGARGYRIPRLSHYLGRWIRGTDWYPDYQLRLYDRRHARWVTRAVHESVEVDGPVRTLSADLTHHPYRDIAHHLETIDRYTTLAAQQLDEDGRRAGLGQLLVHPALAFLRNYILRRGIVIGRAGLIVSILNSYYVFLKFAKLWERQHAPRRHA
jgi:glycosyltransferase involved in cell wall biosynthesis